MHSTGNHSDKQAFGYDSQGRLTAIRHSLDGGAEVTLWSGTYNAVGQLATTRHYYGPFEYLGNSLARVNVPGGYMDGSSKFHAYATDWQGNVRAVVSKQGSGAVAEQATWYYPYGMPTCDSRKATVNRYKYTGKELITDHATNLYDYPARMYDPALGQWLSVDELTHPNAPTSHYAMCASDPINHIDPDGRDYYLFDREGYLLTRTLMKNFDLIAVIDENGNVNISNFYEAGTITPQPERTDIDDETGNEVQINTYNVTGDYNAKDIHEFLSDNLSVEFTRIAIGTTGGSQAINILTTSHLTGKEIGFNNIVNIIHNNGGNVRLFIHNHPSNSKSSGADLKAKNYFQEKSPAFARTRFLIYCKPTPSNSKYYYDYTTPEIDD